MDKPLYDSVQLLRDTATLVRRHVSSGTIAKSHIKLLADAVMEIPGLPLEVAKAMHPLSSVTHVDLVFSDEDRDRLREMLLSTGAAVPETFLPLESARSCSNKATNPSALVTEGDYSEIASAFALLRQQCLNALTSWRQGTYTVRDRTEIAQTICRLPGLAQEVMYASTAKAMQERPAEEEERQVSASPALAAPYGEQTGIPINLCFLATAIETADWSGASIGNKALLVAAVQALRDLHGPR